MFQSGMRSRIVEKKAPVIGSGAFQPQDLVLTKWSKLVQSHVKSNKTQTLKILTLDG